MTRLELVCIVAAPIYAEMRRAPSWAHRDDGNVARSAIGQALTIVDTARELKISDED